MFYYKETALFFGFYSGFTRGEYHVIRVDFICSSRGRLERDRGFANPLSLSNTSPDPFGDPLRRGITAAAVDRDFGFRCPVQVDNPQFRILFGCFVFGLVSLAFQSGCWAWIVRFSLLGEGRLFLRLRGVLLWSIVGFALTAIGAIVGTGNGMAISISLEA